MEPTAANSPAPVMDPTGERMVPENTDDRTFWEHVYRYAFAVNLAKGKRVLDIACGEGYGSASLKSAGAASVIGVDISEAACEHARRKYQVDARVGRAEQIPLPNGSVDLVVSFETVEHVPDPAAFVLECRRVLAPGGLLVMSTPNKTVYGHRPEDLENPYHCSEMTEAEFRAILSPSFPDISLFTQRPIHSGWFTGDFITAEYSPWRKVRGFHRFLRAAHWFDQELHAPLTPEIRAGVVDLVARRSAVRGTVFNPYRIRPSRAEGSNDFLYFIAVGRCKI